MVRFNELRITKDGKYLIIDASIRSQPYYNDVYIDSVSIDTQDTYKDGGPSSSAVYHKKFSNDDFDPVKQWGDKYIGELKDGPESTFNFALYNSLDNYDIKGYYIKINNNYYTLKDGLINPDIDIWTGAIGYVNNGGYVHVFIEQEFEQDFRIVDLSPYSKRKSFRLELGVGEFLPSLSDNMFFVYVKAKGVPAANTPCGMDNEYTLGVTLNTCSLYNTMMSYVRETNQKCTIPKNFIDMFLKFKAFEVSINTEHYAQAIEYYNKYIKNINKLDISVPINRCNCYG